MEKGNRVRTVAGFPAPFPLIGTVREVRDKGPIVAERNHLVLLDHDFIGFGDLWFDPKDLELVTDED